MHRAGYSKIAAAFGVRTRAVEKHVDMGATAIEQYVKHARTA